jgi:hypothetical protein
MVVTASETTVVTNGQTITEAIIGSATLTMSGAATISGKTLSLLSNGIEVAKTTTVIFSSEVQTPTGSSNSDNPSATTGPSAAATSSGAAQNLRVRFAGVAMGGLTGAAAAAAAAAAALL